MKTIYLSLGLLLSSSVFGQQLSQLPAMQTTLEKAGPTVDHGVYGVMSGGDTLAYFDMSTSNQWVVTNEANSPDSAKWQFGAIDPFQRNYAQEINSPTKANGYVWCSGISIILSGKPYNAVRTILTMANPLDLSAVSSASLTFYQNYKPFNSDNCYVEFSGDNGASWISQEINTDGQYTNAPFAMLLPAAVCNKPQVKIRFIWTGDNNGIYGAGYGWQMDDMTIIETPNKELHLGEVLFDGGNDATHFFHKQIPLAQAHMYESQVMVKNNGRLDQNVTVKAVVTKDGAAFGTFGTPTLIVLPPRKDSAIVFQLFKPIEKGHYTVTYTVSGNGPDVEFDNTDNSATADFYVTEGEYSDNDGILWPKGSQWDSFHQQGNASLPFAEVSVVQGFQVWENDLAYSLTTCFPSTNANAFGTDQTLYLELYRFTDATKYGSGYTNQNMQLLSSYEYTVQPDDTTARNATADQIKYKTVFFDEPVPLTPGLYIAMVTSFGGPKAYNIPTYSGKNRDSSGGIRGVIQSGGSNTAYTLYTNMNPFIKLNTMSEDPKTGIQLVNGSDFSLEQNYPNPFDNQTIINYNLSTKNTIDFVVEDITGKQVALMNLGSQNAGNYQIVLNAAEYNAGIYFYSIVVNGEKVTRKLIINQ